MTKRKPGAVRGRPRLSSSEETTYIQISLVPSHITALGHIGGGNVSEGVRRALLAWLAAYAPAQYPGRCVELWRQTAGGALVAVLCERGRPIMAAGPLDAAAAERVRAGDTDLDWSAAMADFINLADESGDEPAYARVWPEEAQEEKP